MIETLLRNAFEAMTRSGRGDAGALAAGLRHNVTAIGLRALAARVLHVTVCSPDRLVDIYDSAAHGWLSGQWYAPSSRTVNPLPLPNAFWRRFWTIVDKPATARSREWLTLATIDLVGRLGAPIHERVASMVTVFAGVEAAMKAGRLEGIDVSRLSAHPSSTLGGAVYSAAAARGVLSGLIDPAVARLETMPPPLRRLNARIEEGYPVWATIAGYSDAELDELGLAAFQLGQFGHHHSAMVLALTMAILAFEQPPTLELVLESIFRGWLHGRTTTPLLDAPWSDLWEMPLEAAREALRVEAYASPLSEAVADAGRLKGT